jgi:hypothetical protein
MSKIPLRMSGWRNVTGASERLLVTIEARE